MVIRVVVIVSVGCSFILLDYCIGEIICIFSLEKIGKICIGCKQDIIDSCIIRGVVRNCSPGCKSCRSQKTLWRRATSSIDGNGKSCGGSITISIGDGIIVGFGQSFAIVQSLYSFIAVVDYIAVCAVFIQGNCPILSGNISCTVSPCDGSCGLPVSAELIIVKYVSGYRFGIAYIDASCIRGCLRNIINNAYQNMVDNGLYNLYGNPE